MDLTIDYNFIASFFSSSFRERILYELSSPKKRIKVLERFSHNTDSIINSDCIYYKGKSIPAAVKFEIKKSASECIALSFEHQQGERMLIDEAFDYLYYESSVIIVVISDWLIIKPEYERGEGLFYVLRKKR